MVVDLSCGSGLMTRRLCASGRYRRGLGQTLTLALALALTRTLTRTRTLNLTLTLTLTRRVLGLDYSEAMLRETRRP